MLDPLIHGAARPKGYGAEMFQHYLIGGLLLVAGTVELLRARGLASARAWVFALPAGLVALGLIFFFHAQHEAEVPVIY